MIANLGAVKPLVSLLPCVDVLVVLLINDSLRGKNDAARTLYTPSHLWENKDKAIGVSVISPLVDLMEVLSTDMVDKVAVLLGNLASIPEGETIVVDGGGIPILVKIVELGSPRGNGTCSNISFKTL